MENKKLAEKSLCSSHLVIYSLGNFCYGACYGVFGPITPYLSLAYNCPQSDFIYLFALKAIGYLITSLLQRYYFASFNFHLRVMLSLLITGTSFFLIPFCKSHFLLGVLSFLSSIMMCWFEILIAVCLLRVSGKMSKQYFSISYGCMSCGAIFASIIIGMFGLDAVFVCGILPICCGLAVYLIQSPESQEKENKKNEELQSESITKQQEKSLCVCFFLYASLILSFCNWMPSFITMAKIGSEEQAAMSLLFTGLPLMIFRFILAFTNVSAKYILQVSSFALITATLGTLFVFQAYPHILVIFTFALIVGISLSSHYPSLFVLPKNFGKVLTESNTAMFALYFAIGEGALSSCLGYFMGWISPLAFLVGILAYAIINRLAILRMLATFEKKITSEKSINTEIETERKANQKIQT